MADDLAAGPGRADVRVDIVTEGLHSGSAGGVIPSTFRIMRQLLDRIEDSETGRVLLQSAHTTIPPHRIAEANDVATDLGEAVFENPPLVEGARTTTAMSGPHSSPKRGSHPFRSSAPMACRQRTKPAMFCGHSPG